MICAADFGTSDVGPGVGGSFQGVDKDQFIFKGRGKRALTASAAAAASEATTATPCTGELATSLTGLFVIFPKLFNLPINPPTGVLGVGGGSVFPGPAHPEKSSGVDGMSPCNDGLRVRALK